jgi:hypothetical protein
MEAVRSSGDSAVLIKCTLRGDARIGVVIGLRYGEAN